MVLQSLVITLVSYMGQLRIAIGSEDGFIDSQKLKSCMENAFDMILKGQSCLS
ncbi:hypothetical protein Pint_02270 [Pistacia integerrima]|uniref:Uncharacterized protein n=1 Tax=Pistacia integerrima TaxID=434235 RepID=A0ACC0ZM44_9ROSI|nr:hypothetical protein Pint_02270 [Pistacia integerrima]